MWKFQDFPVIQILCEIKIGESRNPKTTVVAIFEALDFVSLVNFSFHKVQKLTKLKFQSLQMCQKGKFCTSRVPKFDFT